MSFGLKKVISFTLYGDIEKYTKGALKNAELAQSIYPDWRCRFYIHENSVPPNIVSSLREFPNVDIILFQDLKLATSKRFTVIDDPNVDIMIVRDCDSQLSKREKLAVDEWIESDKSLHIMRDHPHHGDNINGHLIMAGMFGMKKTSYWEGWDTIFKQYLHLEGKWGLDQDILQQHVYPLFNKHDDIFVHASFNKHEPYAKDFPSDYDEECHFVGEWFYYDGTRYQEHIDILIHALSLKKIENKQ